MIALFGAMGVELPEAGTVVALAHGDRLAARRHAGHALASILPARRATRVPPIAAVREGSTLPAVALRRAPPSAGLGVVARRRWPRCSPGCSSAGRRRSRSRCCSSSACSALFLGIALLAPRLVEPLARVVGLAGAPLRRRRGRAGRRQRTPQPRPHRVHGRGADDRPHARHRRRRARRRACSARPTRRSSEQVNADYVVDGKEGAAVPGRRGRRARRASPGVEDRLARPLRHGARGRQERRHRHRRGHDRPLLHFKWPRAPSWRWAGSGPTGRS